MRDPIRTLVASIPPLDTLEEEHIRWALDWIDSGAPLCRIEKPATPPRHLVSYFVLADLERGRILLGDHRNAGLWLPSGGHVEPDEHPRDTVRREIREELSCEAVFVADDPIFITVTETVGATAGHTDVSLWYALHGESTRKMSFDRGEYLSVQWFPLDDLPTGRTDPHLQRFTRKLAAMFPATAP